MAAIDRLASVTAARFFLPVRELTPADREMLVDAFLDRAKSKAEQKLSRLLDASWSEIEALSRGFHWTPGSERCAIEDYGPRPVIANTVFNRQPNGLSAMWVRLSRAVEPGSKLRLGDTVLETLVKGRVLTAFVPLAAIGTAGQKPLVVLGPDGQARSAVSSFEVVAPGTTSSSR